MGLPAGDREVSLDVVDEDQMGVLARKPGLSHGRGHGGRSRGSIVFNCSRAMVSHASCETILVEGDMALVSSR